jgi:hypothetical protein
MRSFLNYVDKNGIEINRSTFIFPAGKYLELDFSGISAQWFYLNLKCIILEHDKTKLGESRQMLYHQ